MLITRFVRGFFAQIAVLTGLVVGALVAIPMGLTDFCGVASAPWFGMAQPFPDTIFAQNVGLVQLTGVRSRFVPAVAGAALLLLGLVPKFGEAVASLPGPVVGGAGLVMFAMVTAVGIRTLHKVEFDGTNNIMIVAVALGIGMLPVVAPSFHAQVPGTIEIVIGSSITSCAIVAFALNLLFHHLPWGRPPGTTPPGDTGSAAAARHVP